MSKLLMVLKARSSTRSVSMTLARRFNAGYRHEKDRRLVSDG